MNTTLESPTTTSSGNASPAIRTVTPYLVCGGAAAAIDFYTKAFGAVEELRITGNQNRLIHARIRIGDSAVMLMDEFPEWGSFGPKALKAAPPVSILIYVDNVDEVFARAVAAGAKAVMPVEDMFWGDRYGVLEDPFGHHWSIATHKRDLTAAELQEAAKASAMA